MAALVSSSQEEEKEAKDRTGIFLSRILVGKSRLYLTLFVTFAIINGAGLVAFGPLLSNTMNSIADPNSSSSDVSQSSLYLVYCAIGLMVVAFLMAFFAGMTSSAVAHRLRFILVKNCMKLDAEFFDTDTAPGEVINTLTSQTKQVEVFLSSSLPQLLNGTSKAVAAIIVCFVYSWNVTLVTISLLISMGFVMMFVNVVSKRYEKISYSKTQTVLNKASGVLGNIKTVISFHAWMQAYDDIALGIHACVLDKYYVVTTAFGQGIIMTANLGMSTLALWYSGLSINQGKNSQFEVISVISTISLLVEGMLYVIIALPSLRSFSSAMREIGILIDASPKVEDIVISTVKEDGELEKEGKSCNGSDRLGSLEFANVSFAYPVQREVQVLDDISFVVKPGTSIALVGASGSGKSTVVSLLFRFYDPLSGKIMINGRNTSSMTLKDLRSALALVSQEPVLFAKSIRENIMYGSLNASEDEMIRAAKAAAVHDFIMSLPDGYDTQVGEKGTQLSGGQKQRIAIARAVIRKPHIFVFDEATSALDTKSERSIQAAIDMITDGSTSLTVAHRLSTVRNKDNIISMRNGKVIEEGNHNRLMELHGYYHDLVESQHSPEADSPEDSETNVVSPLVKNYSNSIENRYSDVEQTGDLVYISSKLSNISSKVLDILGTVSRRQSSLKELHEDASNLTDGRDSSSKSIFIFKVVGAVSSLCIGSSLPIGGYFASRFFGLYYEDPVPMDELSKWAWGLAGLAFLMGIIAVIQEYCWVRFTNMFLNTLRLDTFIALLRQEYAWYEQEENNLGALMSLIGSHSSQASQAIKDSWYYGCIATGSLISAFVIAFTQQWIITFIMISALVLMFLVVGVMSWLMQDSQQSKERLELTCDSNLAENIFQYKIVSSFNLQDARLEEFNTLQTASDKYIRYISFGGGAIQGLSLFIGLSVYALAFWYGGKLIDQGNITFQQLTGAIFPIFLGLVGLVNAQLQLPAISQGNKYLESAALLHERTPLIDNTSSEGRRMISCDLGIDFKRLSFAYPSRPSQNIFTGLDLHVAAHTSMAVVGGSGSGKSTIISLLLRLYDPDSGSIMIDGVDIKSMSLDSLRKAIGLVGQEPVLFDATILDNIRYGTPSATIEDCKRAARECLAEDFILNMPDGYNTHIGSKGVALSGGQKQRIAIARAIVKKPFILLLDEATSALDVSSEVEVQKTLDKVMKDQTAIVVAHRLHTVRNVDMVTVLDTGSIVEQGTYSDLETKKDGVFASMLRLQK